MWCKSGNVTGRKTTGYGELVDELCRTSGKNPPFSSVAAVPVWVLSIAGDSIQYFRPTDVTSGRDCLFVFCSPSSSSRPVRLSEVVELTGQILSRYFKLRRIYLQTSEVPVAKSGFRVSFILISNVCTFYELSRTSNIFTHNLQFLTVQNHFRVLF